jgi:hypothetical protein
VKVVSSRPTYRLLTDKKIPLNLVLLINVTTSVRNRSLFGVKNNKCEEKENCRKAFIQESGTGSNAMVKSE